MPDAKIMLVELADQLGLNDMAIEELLSYAQGIEVGLMLSAAAPEWAGAFERLLAAADPSPEKRAGAMKVLAAIARDHPIEVRDEARNA